MLGEQGIGIGVIVLQGENGVCLFGGLVRLMACQQQVAQVDARLQIVGLQIDRAHQFRVALHHRALLQVDLGQLIVGVAEVMVDLQRVRELDRCLLQLALIFIALSAVQIAVLQLVRIAFAAHIEAQCHGQTQNYQKLDMLPE